MKTRFKILFIILGFFLLLCLGALIFVIVLDIKSKRIGNVDLEISNESSNSLEVNKTYKIATYNIGFGAYDRDFSFFMDEGYDSNGNKLKGKYGKGVSRENTIKNTKGAISILKSVDFDFLLAQEVDTKSTRSYKINQRDMVVSAFNDYSSTYAVNFHSGFLPYPINDMHGVVNSGILTLSKYKMKESKRIELPIDTSFFKKFFDLDRCLNITRYDVGDKELVIINAHLSAYDEGGVYRRAQLNLLNKILKEEHDNNNYVIVGGDFNHDLVNSYDRKLFKTNQLRPDWLVDFPKDELCNGYNIYACDSEPSCRDADVAYKKGETFTSVVDGFIVSDNILVSNVSTITNALNEDVEFLYSDHNAVVLEFSI